MKRQINRREFLRMAAAAGAGAATMAMLPGCVEQTLGQSQPCSASAKKPNFIVILTDDQGYADAGCYGAKDFETPNLDRMAAEGIRFTDFYSAAPVCTPSRAAMLTGCYPQRVGLPNVIGPGSATGLSSEEQTIAELLKTQGYATACYGKWHLGDNPKFLPLRHGFDEYFGLPYSNDMWPHNPMNPNFPDLPLIEGEKVIGLNPDQSKLTTWYTERSVKFIEKNKDKPFFLYVSHTMPHVPLHVSDKFKGKSKQGLYGDVIMEIDWSVGQILSTLKRLGLDDNTMVIFTSDNGPWLLFGDHGGSAGPLREGKATTFDGGQRVPCIMRWPGKIPAGKVSSEMIMIMDFLPTLANLAGGQLSSKPIDGKDIWPILSGKPGAKSPHEAFFFYLVWGLQAVRSGKWKLHVPHQYKHFANPGKGGKPGSFIYKNIGLSLFDLEKDIGEQHNVAAEHPDVVERLLGLADKMRHDIGDDRLKIKGEGKREPGRI